MIVTKVGRVYEVDLPASVNRLLGSFSVAVSFGFTSVGSILQCLDMSGYVNTLLLYMVMPLALAALIVVIALIRLRCNGTCTARAALEMTTPALLKLAFLAYPLIANVAFDAFSCYKFKDSEWLKADVAIQCDTQPHYDALALAWAAIVIYPIGLLLVNAALLFAARHAISSGRPTDLSRAIAFLYREYEPHLFWWEVTCRANASITKPCLLLLSSHMQGYRLLNDTAR